jgi:hypothetical protein
MQWNLEGKAAMVTEPGAASSGFNGGEFMA